MSKKSTARTGSEGDADSTTYTEVFTNICSGSSSCKSKRDLDGGPYGDSPRSDKNQDRFKDFLILMFQENENPTDSSEGSDADQELYDLQNDYLEKLNIVRKRLNLVEISDDAANIIQPVYSTCTITEVLDEETSNSRSGRGSQKEQHHVEQKESCSGASNNSGNLTYTYELNTIYPPSPTYNRVDSVSATNIFDLDYNPPKKKVCHRLNTPRFISTSDGQIPYYTKVGLREDLFKKEDKPKRRQNIIKRSIHKFTRSKETQCTEDELGLPQETPVEERLQKQPSNTNLFPEVIIEVKEKPQREDKSVSSQSSKKCATVSDHKDRDSNISPLNLIRDNSEDESYVTITTNTTIINTPKKRKKARKRRFGGKNKVNSSEKLTMWEEIRNMQSSHYPIIAGKEQGQSDNSEDAVADTGECNSTISNIPKYIDGLSENIQLKNVIDNEKSQYNTDSTSQYAIQYNKYKESLKDAKLGIAYGAKVMKKVVVKDTLLQRTCHVKPKRKKNLRRSGGNYVSVPVSRRRQSLVTEDEIFLRLKTVRRRSNGVNLFCNFAAELGRWNNTFT